MLFRFFIVYRRLYEASLRVVLTEAFCRYVMQNHNDQYRFCENFVCTICLALSTTCTRKLQPHKYQFDLYGYRVYTNGTLSILVERIANRIGTDNHQYLTMPCVIWYIFTWLSAEPAASIYDRRFSQINSKCRLISIDSLLWDKSNGVYHSKLVFRLL